MERERSRELLIYTQQYIQNGYNSLGFQRGELLKDAVNGHLMLFIHDRNELKILKLGCMPLSIRVTVNAHTTTTRESSI